MTTWAHNFDRIYGEVAYKKGCLYVKLHHFGSLILQSRF